MKSQNDSVHFDTAAVYQAQSLDINDLLEFIPDLICMLTAQGYIIGVSAAAKDTWGYAPGELRGRSFLDLIAPEDHSRSRQIMEQVKQGTVLNDFFNHCQCKDGTVKPMLWSARWDTGKQVAYWVGRKSTEQWGAEKKAREFEQRMYRAYQLAGIGWWEWLVEGEQLQVSDELYEIYGLNKADYPCFTTEDYLALVHPDDREHVLANIAQDLLPSFHQYDHRLIRPSGEEIHVIHYIRNEFGANGRFIKRHGLTKNITGRKQAEAALKQSQQKLKDIVESLGDGFFVLDREWRITYWNRKAEEITGLSRQTLLGTSFWQLYPKAQQLKFYPQFSRALTENIPVCFEEFSPTLQGWMEVSAYPTAEGLSVYIRDVTERKRHEKERGVLNEKLKKTQEHLLNVLENMSDGFFIIDRSYTICFATDKVAAMLGLQKEEYIGKNLWEWFPQSRSKKFYAAYQKAFDHNTLVSFEEFMEGLNMWFEVSAYPNEDQLSVYIRDITERKRQERALQISNERFHFVAQATSDVVWDWNLETKELYISPSFTKVFGYELNEDHFPGSLWLNNLYTEDRQRVLASQAIAIQGRTVFLWEDHYRFFKKCGEIAYVTDRAVIIRNEEGRAVRMVGAVQDITERKRQEQRLEFMAKATSEVIWERGVDDEEVALTTEKFNQLFGYALSGDRSCHSFWLDKVHPEDLPRLIANREEALHKGLDFYVDQYRFKRADDSWAFVQERTYLVKGAEGGVVSLLGAIEDITPQRLAEKALRESESGYRQLFDYAPLPTLISDTETLQYLDVNDAALRHFGYSHEEFLQMTVMELRSKEEQQQVLDFIPLIRKHCIHQKTFRYLKKSGEVMVGEASASIIDYKGKPAYLTTIMDVTEKVKLQKALTNEKVNHQKDITRAIIETQEKERSEIGKELHDNVNQMLTTAKLYVENITYYPEQGAQFAARSVAILQASINEIRRLSRALVTPTIRDVGFKDTLGELVGYYLELNRFEVTTVFDFHDTCIPKGIKLTVYRILQEAFNNTVKYAHASQVQVLIHCSEGNLKLVYVDNGVGFDPAAQKRGIGLQNIQNRSDAYRGTVSIASAPGKGCTLTILFPLTDIEPQDIPTNINHLTSDYE